MNEIDIIMGLSYPIPLISTSHDASDSQMWHGQSIEAVVSTRPGFYIQKAT